jgi:hypothetical protein
LRFVKLGVRTDLNIAGVVFCGCDIVCDIVPHSGEDDLKRMHGRPEQNVDPRQRAAQRECDYKNCPIQASPADVFCNRGVKRRLVCGPQLIRVRHLLIPGQRRARSILAADCANLRILNNATGMKKNPGILDYDG